MEITATVTNIFIGNGSGVHSRVWVQADQHYNFDVIDQHEALRYQRGMQIKIKVENGKARPI